MADIEEKLRRDDLAMKLLCAFNGIEPGQAPPSWWYYANESMRSAWHRVADVVREEARLIAASGEQDV